MTSRNPRVGAGAAAVLLVGAWVVTGSSPAALVVVLVVTVVVAVVLGIGALGGPALRPRPPRGEDVDDPGPVVAALPTTDLAFAPGPAASVRRLLRGALSRPWVRGDALVRATSTRLGAPGALVSTARGELIAAPHLWVEWNVADAAEIAARRPLGPLAAELVADHVERIRGVALRRPATPTTLHLLARDDVPVGRVVVTGAFSAPRDPAVAVAVSGGPRPGPPAPARVGTLLDAPVPATLVPEPARPGRRGAVVVGDGPVRLGRDPASTVVVDHPGVSWRHAAVAPGGPLTWVVSDAGSTNGTFVDGHRITGPTPLRPGGVVALGHDGPRWRLRPGGPGGPGGGGPGVDGPVTARVGRTRRETV